MSLQSSLDDLLEKQEAFWFMRSRVSDIQNGEKNTKYFHHKVSQRKRKNCIHGLYDSSGVWREDVDDIEKIITDYYSSLFSSSSPSDESEMDVVLEAVSSKISVVMNRELSRDSSKEEVLEALNQMKPCKAPGPDNMHALFYQKIWHIGADVTSLVSGIIHGTRPPDMLNKTNVILIPKVKSRTLVSECRPIRLCNVIYELV